MKITEIKAGDRLTWLYEARGGYGYVTPVSALVVRVGQVRVLVEVQQLRPRCELVQRWVRPDHLRRELMK